MLSRRDFLRSAATGAIALALPQVLFSKTEGTDKPNIILCMADDMGWGAPGFNGNKITKTDNLDAMAKAGMRFTRFYSGAPVSFRNCRIISNSIRMSQKTSDRNDCAMSGHISENRTESFHLVSGLDIMSTLCDYAGIKPPKICVV